MKVRFAIAKYIPDLFKNEPKNIGVIVWSEQAVTARFLGEKKPNDIDGRTIRHGYGDTAVYKQWVNYWRDCMGQETIEPARGGEPVSRTSKDFLDVLISDSRGKFALQIGGEALSRAEDDLQTTLDDLYRRIVNDEPEEFEAVPKSVTLEDVAESILADTHFKEVNGFVSNFVPAAREQCRFDFGHQNGKVSLFQKVSLPQSAPTLEKNYKSTAWDFQEVIDGHVINDKSDGFSLVFVEPERVEERVVKNAMGALGRVSTVINLCTEPERFAKKLEELKLASH